jgi:hypothetical protein
MSTDQEEPVQLVRITNLTEVTVLSADASFAIRAVSVTLRYPAPEGQREVLSRLADHAADRADLVHRALEQALQQLGKKGGQN